MKVIGAGFGRTGTMSLKVALEELGAGPCLHPLQTTSVKGREGACSHWEQIANGESVDWRETLEGWGSTVDWLGVRYYREMIDAWPGARVILSIRDPESWYESFDASINASQDVGDSERRERGAMPSALKAEDHAVWKGIFDGRFGERDYALKVFEDHNREVASRVPDDRLLVYDIHDGWEPLCEFLEVEIPETPFPHLNNRTSFRARLGMPRKTPRERVPLPIASVRSVRRSLSPRISGLALADPATSFSQDEMLTLLGLDGDEFAEGIFGRCGVKRRQLNLTDEVLATTLQGRTPGVEEQLLEYSIKAVDALEIDPLQIGTVISATLYSLGGPTLAHRLVDHYGMDPSTDKYHVVGVGCASAVPLVRLVSQSLPQHPGKMGLLVAAESMSGILMRADPSDQRSKTVGSAIFGDGCAAALIDGRADADGPAIIASKVHQIAGTLGAVRLELTPEDSYLHLLRELPEVAGASLSELVDEFLAENDLASSRIEHWLIHPGGRRIIENVQSALSLSDEDVRVSYEVLADHGNVGTPSIFYVLKRTIEQRAPGREERGLMVTIGPGVTVGLLLLEW